MNAQPVDHDLLARYVGGALDDSPDGADVAELVATDPEWADAHDRLVLALEAVKADLAAYAAIDEPMPDDVAARLEEALADAPPGLTVVPGGRSDGPGPRHQRRKKIPGWLAPVAVAAGVVAFAGFWLNSAGGGFDAGDGGSGSGSDTNASSSDAGGKAEQAPAAAGAITRREATGQDYDKRQVADGPGRFASRSSAAPGPSALGGSGEETVGTYGTDDAAAPAELARLTAPAALAECLGAIAAEHGVPIATTSAVDYARFEDKPALVVYFVDASGGQWAWVAGPDCGPGGADTRYFTRVA